MSSDALTVAEYIPAEEAGRRVEFVLMITIWGMALRGLPSDWILDVSGSYELAFLNGIAWNLINIELVMALFFCKPKQDCLFPVGSSADISQR